MVCHEYGQRPLWMDRGPLQKEAARRLKTTVSRRSTSAQEPGTTSQEPSGPYRASTNGNLNAYGSSDLNRQLMIGGFDLDLSTGGDVQKDNPFYEQAWDENLLAAPFYIDLGSNADPANLFDPWVLSSTNTTPLAQSQLAFANAETTIDLGSLDTAAATVAGFQQTEPLQLWSDRTLPMQQDYFEGPARRSMSGPQMPLHKPRYSNTALSPPVNGQTMHLVDDELLMDYFDRVFYIYCPFYTSRQQHSRGWLLSLLRGECSSYHAAMALTELHRSTGPSLNTKEQGSHHRLALQKLQKGLAPFTLGIRPASPTVRISLLTSILHLFLYEVRLQAHM